MARTSWRRLDAGKGLERLVIELAAAHRAGDRTRLPSIFTEADPACLHVLPAWVARAALLTSRSTWWLWCEPRKGARSGGGQFVMDVPAGRYMVDIFDTRVHAWFSRESAQGAPLVAGLPATGRPVLARIRRVSASTGRPRE